MAPTAAIEIRGKVKRKAEVTKQLPKLFATSKLKGNV
jgi:hypothetical protein